MNDKKHHFQKSFSVFIGCICVVVLTVSGCTPLRKKFTRKKKDDGGQSQKFIPVLEPIDYPEKVYLPLEKYKHHYSLWKVWEKDLLQTIDRGGSDKRQKYLLEQSVIQLEEMRKVLISEKQAEFSVLVNELRSVQEVYERPASMRSKFSIKKKIERNASRVRGEFAPDPLLVGQEL